MSGNGLVPAPALLACLGVLGLGVAGLGVASAGAAEAPLVPAASPEASVPDAAPPGRGLSARAAGNPRATCLAAARLSEAAHGIPPGLLVAIALTESGLHAYAMNIGGRSHFPASAEEARRVYRAAMPGQAVMAGCVQVNAGVHARGSDWPLDPWRSADWGAGLLRAHYARAGNWAEAIRRWHGGASGNALACRVQARLQVTNPGSDVLGTLRCGATAVARDRRNGAALLEIAEAAN